jgi:prophage regulatory protein
MNPLPTKGYLRLNQIVGDKKQNPPIPPLIPISQASWWRGVKSGKYPPAIKLGPRTTVWRAEDVMALIEQGDVSHLGGHDVWRY